MLKLRGVVVFTCCVLAFSARATLIDVYQGNSPNLGTFKGTIEAYSGVDSAVANYDYFSHSGHPTEGPNLKFNRGEIFFYDGPEGTTFNVLFNKEKNNQADPNTSGLVSWNIAALSFGDPSVLLSDDKKELKEDGSDFFKGRWEWNNNTDGGIIQGLDLPFWAVIIDPKEYQGVDSLKVFSADGGRINMNLRTGERGFMFFAVHVPDAGGTIYLLSAGVFGLALASSRMGISGLTP